MNDNAVKPEGNWLVPLLITIAVLLFVGGLAGGIWLHPLFLVLPAGLLVLVLAGGI